MRERWQHAGRLGYCLRAVGRREVFHDGQRTRVGEIYRIGEASNPGPGKDCFHRLPGQLTLGAFFTKAQQEQVCRPVSRHYMADWAHCKGFEIQANRVMDTACTTLSAP